MVRVGIVGTGRTVSIANNHLAGYLKDTRAEVVAVYNSHPETAVEWVKRNGLNAKVCSSFEELLDMVDAVSICTPNLSHYDYVCRTVAAHKHFIIEKPITVSIEDCLALEDLCRDYDKVNMVSFTYRYSDVTKTARDIVRSKVGRIYSITGWFGGKRQANPQIPFEWRQDKSVSGSGALCDVGSHLVDLADFIAGQRYSEVSCMCETVIKTRADRVTGEPRQVTNDDVAVFTARGDNSLASFTLNRTGLDPVMMLISGQGGLVQLSLREGGFVKYWDKDPMGPYSGKESTFTFEGRNTQQTRFDDQIKDFIDAIEGKTDDYPDVVQGCYVQKVIHAAEVSSESSAFCLVN